MCRFSYGKEDYYLESGDTNMHTLRAMLATNLIIMTLIAAGCSSSTNSTTAKTTATSTFNSTAPAGSIVPALSNTPATYTDAAQPVTAVVGQEITFALLSNPTTGYSWQSVYDNSTFSLVNDMYSPDAKADKNLVGSGGTQYVTLKTLKSGQAAVTFNYRRPWEKDVPPAKQQIFNVTIR
jgi:inhibitor of cysteine peptidase